MNFMEWQADYSVNIAKIDKQHKNLVDLINRLHAAILSGKAEEALTHILTDLVYYTIYHFETEEGLFDEYDYPESESHKQEHRDLIQKVSALQSRHTEGEKVITQEVMKFLHDWLRGHILGTDKAYVPFLNSKGVH
jgi:hemerythrin